MPKHRLASSHAEDLADGRVLAPGETADVDTVHPHNRRLVDEGKLLPLEPEREPTLEDLRKRAADLEIEGRSSMNAHKLRHAIAEAEVTTDREETR